MAHFRVLFALYIHKNDVLYLGCRDADPEKWFMEIHRNKEFPSYVFRIKSIV